jgi:hypothetical protein
MNPSEAVAERLEVKTIGAFAIPFATAFKRASERRLRVLYDEVSPKLSEGFDELAVGGEGQLEVLNRLAEMVGLEDLDLSKPLPDEESEALAQRVAWRAAARWSILTLLWALVENQPNAYAPADWVEVATRSNGKAVRSQSGLPLSDEPLALATVAESLTESVSATDGLALALLDLPVVIRTQSGGGISAEAVRPVALIETTVDLTNLPADLAAGDRIWLAELRRGFSLEGNLDSSDTDILTLSSPSKLSLDPQIRAISVVGGVKLLIEGNSLEDRG